MRSNRAAGANERGAGAVDGREVSALGKALPFWPWLAAIASGLLGMGCCAPLNQDWLCWFALTPLLAAIWFSGGNSKRRWLRDLLLGYVAGVVFFTGTFGWLGSLGALFEAFWLHGLPLLLSLYLAMNFAFWGWLCGLVRPRPTKMESTKDKWSEMLEHAGKPAQAMPITPMLRSTNDLSP